MDVLYYWRPDNYTVDASFGFGYHLNQNSPALAQLQPGDHVWAFTRLGSQGYVLAADLLVASVTQNRPGFRYGQYRVWGDLVASRYFDTDTGPAFEPVVRSLSISAVAVYLAQSFQGWSAVRVLSPQDSATLKRLAAKLPVLQTAAIYPEDQFEAALLHGDESVQEFLPPESSDQTLLRLRYLYERIDRSRSRTIVRHLLELYNGQCQICAMNPGHLYGLTLVDGHHLIWLSRGGEDVPENVVLLCPNHHAAVHRGSAAFDFGTLCFRYANGIEEPVRLNRHLAGVTK